MKVLIFKLYYAFITNPNIIIMNKLFILTLLMMLSCMYQLNAQFEFPGNDPNEAKAKQSKKFITLENDAIAFTVATAEGWIGNNTIMNKYAGKRIDMREVVFFELIAGNDTITSDDFTLNGQPVVSDINPTENFPRYSSFLPGKKISAEFENSQYGIKIGWEASLHDGSNYVRQTYTFNAKDEKIFSEIILLRIDTSNVKIAGTVDGTPLINGPNFFAIEHPLSKTKQEEGAWISYMPEITPVISTVHGVAPKNQLRRSFLYYIERERSYPYHQILHYNSWYDISWDDRKFDERESLDRIKGFADSLIVKRKVEMDAFLFDDGWDDNKTLWKFHSGFLDEFKNVKKAAESIKSTIGVWMSPFGGYGPAKKSRIEYGNLQNPPFETNNRGFALAGPVYYQRFRDVALSFIKDYKVSMFKFDGVGSGSGSEITYRKDVEAFLTLLNDLRALDPYIYLSLTTGTWASPFWLFYGDNIWRGGGDTGMTGEGLIRQQWITYRDAQTYKNVVSMGQLYPLNSLMLGGICIADNGNPRKFELNDKDISDEIWSFFSSGTNLQELYVNPHKLNSNNWDELMKAAKWAKENEETLIDVHWYGGDPGKNEVYAFASWSADADNKAILMVRNPSLKPQTFSGEITRIFELPYGNGKRYKFVNVRTGENAAVSDGKTIKLKLEPFDVIVLEGIEEY